MVSDSSSEDESKASNGHTSPDPLPPPAAANASSLAQQSDTQQKRPMNAFLIFCKRHRSVVKQKYPYLENRSITKILAEWWAALDSDQKQQYTDVARQYKEAFMKANPHFKWYKTDIKAPPAMQPPSPPPVAPPSTENHSPVAPPKKRYLESKEFK
ncbi:SOX transcription factor-like protein, partial [Dinothrombium tinctorium]